MGLIIRSSLETDIGNVDSPYVVITSYKVLKTQAEIGYSVGYFSNKKYWEDSLPYSIEDIGNPKELPFESRFSPGGVIYPKDKEWVEVNLPTHFNVKLSKIKNVEVPILEDKEIIKKTPYVTFDKEGNEITAYEEEKIIDQVEVGKETVEKELIDYKSFDNPINFAYKHLKSELEKLLINIKIEDN